jgi:hypothetical protein
LGNPFLFATPIPAILTFSRRKQRFYYSFICAEGIKLQSAKRAQLSASCIVGFSLRSKNVRKPSFRCNLKIEPIS